MIKKIGIALLFILIGVFLGRILTTARPGGGLSKATFLLQEGDLVRVKQAAGEAFEKESPETGIWALEFYLDFSDAIIKQRLAAIEQQARDSQKVSLAFAPQDRFFEYAKLALLYDKIGNQAKRDENLRKAAQTRGKADDPKYKEELLQVMEELYQERNAVSPSKNRTTLKTKN